MRLSTGFKFGFLWATVYGLSVLTLPDPWTWGVPFSATAVYLAAMAVRALKSGRLPWLATGSLISFVGFGASAWFVLETGAGPLDPKVAAALALALLGLAVSRIESRARPEAWRELSERANESSVLGLLLGRHLHLRKGDDSRRGEV